MKEQIDYETEIPLKFKEWDFVSFFYNKLETFVYSIRINSDWNGENEISVFSL